MNFIHLILIKLLPSPGGEEDEPIKSLSKPNFPSFTPKTQSADHFFGSKLTCLLLALDFCVILLEADAGLFFLWSFSYDSCGWIGSSRKTETGYWRVSFRLWKLEYQSNELEHVNGGGGGCHVVVKLVFFEGFSTKKWLQTWWWIVYWWALFLIRNRNYRILVMDHGTMLERNKFPETTNASVLSFDWSFAAEAKSQFRSLIPRFIVDGCGFSLL